MTPDQSPLGAATLYSVIGRELILSGSRADVVAAVAQVALTRMPRAVWVSVTEGEDGRFSTVTATDQRARTADRIQYKLGAGPCIDALSTGATVRIGDLGQDGRWPEFAQRARDLLGLQSLMSFRLHVEDDPRTTSLNLYSTSAHAFDDDAEVAGTLIAAHGALAIAAATAREHAVQLQTALANSREIGMAMGVVMATYKLTREQAFDLLRISSQDSNRKLADIATEVVDTGTLNLSDSRLEGVIGANRGRAAPPTGA